MAGNFIQINVNVKEQQKGSEGVKQRRISQGKSTANQNSSLQDKVDKIKDAIDFEKKFTKQGEKATTAGKKIGYTAAAIGVNTASELVDMGIGTVKSAMTMRNRYGGNSAKANAVSNKMSAAEEITGGVMSTVSAASTGLSIGSAIGGIAGPIGAAIGAVVGLAIVGIQTAVGNSKEISELKTEILSQQLEATKKAARLGIITSNRGRTNASEYLM